MSAANAPTCDARSSDASLLDRIAAVSDKAALAELDARHGMTLYAIAYAVLLDPGAADAAVAAALRDAWRKAAAFDARTISAGRWLADLTRRAARERVRRASPQRGGAAARPARVTTPPRPPSRRLGRALARWVTIASALVIPAILMRCY